MASLLQRARRGLGSLCRSVCGLVFSAVLLVATAFMLTLCVSAWVTLRVIGFIFGGSRSCPQE